MILFSIIVLLNVAIEWLVLLIRIWKVLDSNLGSKTGYSEGYSSCFPQYLHAYAGIVITNEATTEFSPHDFYLIIY
jgi:hypothetical protein